MHGLTFGFGPLEAEFWRWMFLMTRIGAALVAAPIFGATNVPAEVRVIVTAAIAALVAGWTGVQPPPDLASLAGMVAVCGELLVGLAMGFVLQFSFAAPTIAAEIIGDGMGLGMAATIDPNTGAHSPALGQYFGVVLTVIFLSLGGHLQWIALLVRSYDVFPPGHTWLGPDRFMTILGFASTMFATAVAIALPITLMLLLVQVFAGVLSRTAPALNLFALALPAGIIVGLTALMMSAPLITDQLIALSHEAIAATGRILEH